jgi:hypothetical protein
MTSHYHIITSRLELPQELLEDLLRGAVAQSELRICLLPNRDAVRLVNPAVLASEVFRQLLHGNNHCGHTRATWHAQSVSSHAAMQ